MYRAKEISSFKAQLAGYTPFLAERYAKNAELENDVVTRMYLQNLTFARRMFYGSIIGSAAFLASAVTSENKILKAVTALGFICGIILIRAGSTKLSVNAEALRRRINHPGQFDNICNALFR